LPATPQGIRAGRHGAFFPLGSTYPFPMLQLILRCR
jgi:hypothetical protein